MERFRILVLALAGAGEQPAGVRMEVPVEGEWPAAAQRSEIPPALQQALAQAPQNTGTSGASSSGTVGDIATHVVDLAHYLVGPIAEVIAMTKTYVTTRPIQQGGVDKLGASEKSADAERAPVDVDDEVVSMLRFGNGAIGSLEATRNAWGRNNFITLEIHGTKGSIAFNYERRDELQVMFADDPADARGFRTVYTGPAHPYGQGLWPIPGLGIGYSETKIVECHDFFDAIATGKQPSPNFADGLACELVADALLRSGETGLWEAVGQ